MRTLFLFLAVLLSGCDPAYFCAIRNKSNNDIYVKTLPPIESLYMKESSYYDSLLSYKVMELDSYSVYRIKPKMDFLLYGRIGFSPSLQEVPINFIEIIKESDTVLLDSKEKIFQRLEREGKTRKYFINE